MTHRLNFPLLLLLLTLTVISCSDTLSDTPSDTGRQLLLIANEGNFTEGNGSLTWHDSEGGATLQRRFEQVNGRPLGGIVQSIHQGESRLYIVTNSPDKVEVVTLPGLNHESTLQAGDAGITPAHFSEITPERGYVSSLYGNAVYMVDLTTMTIDDTPVPIGSNPGAMIHAGAYLFVADNGFGNGETVTVIDVSENQVVETLSVGAGPTTIAQRTNGTLWVLSAGRTAYDENWNRDPENDRSGQVDLIDPATLQVIESISLNSQTHGLTLDERTGNAWILTDQGTLWISMDTRSVESAPLPSRSFRTLAVSPWKDQLFLGESRGYDQSGQVLIATLEGALIDSFTVGVAPLQIEFVTVE